MKPIKIHILLMMIVLSSCSMKEKNVTKNTLFPDWIVGTWHNYGESNANNFIFWRFENDTIELLEGFPIKSKEILNKKYTDYHAITYCSDSIFQIKFSKEKDTIIYNFRLEKLEWEKRCRALSYALTINGIKIQEHSTNMGYILINQEDFSNENDGCVLLYCRQTVSLQNNIENERKNLIY
ncbi:MAG: hypothetical protein FWH36_04180 [Lentimicrobiaceae bacterium]|nr:hypothetical protein [Lentimicrobiaceae bacterium]